MLDGKKFNLEVELYGEWFTDLYTKCQNEMTLQEFLSVFNGGWGMVLAVEPDNWNLLKYSIQCEIIGEVL